MYQALYRKYRPQVFDDVVGQTAVTQTLKNQFLAGRLSHAYLFTGSRGTGKTTCAKILAKLVNCEHPVDGNPCNCCNSCRSIDAAVCPDVQEIDAASNNGVDYVRTLREESAYTPASSAKRVYIIDEVHMLSIAAFNALLKIMEEPPAHLMFILATTELHKVPATILSRCQRFSFRRLTQEDIYSRLNQVAYLENIDIQQDALQLLARLGDGALRDGLSLLDQCAAAASGPLTAEAVASVLGLAGSRRSMEWLATIADADTAAALRLLDEFYAAGKDITAMTNELSTMVRDLLILKTAPESGENLLSGSATVAELRDLAERFTAEELLRILSLLQATASGYARSQNRKLDLELCLIELCVPALSEDYAALNARISKMEDALASGIVPQRKAPAKKASITADAREETPPPEKEPSADSVPKPQKENAVPNNFWPSLLDKAKTDYGPQIAMFTGGISAWAVTDGVLTITFSSDLLRQQFDREKLPDLFREKASLLLGVPIRVRLTSDKEEPSDKFEDFLNRANRLGSDIVTVR